MTTPRRRSRLTGPRGHRERGQGLVEFSMVVPVFMLVLLGILEFGFIFDHTMTLSYATREGARSGAAFGPGNGSTMICDPVNGGLDVDKHIVASIERVLKAPGSQVVPSRVTEIRIFKADSNGAQMGGLANVWTYAAGSGPIVDGQPLDFVRASWNWSACSRDASWTGGVAPDSIGIGISYGYQYVTPLAAIVGFFGPPGTPSMTITDRTVMALNPLD